MSGGQNPARSFLKKSTASIGCIIWPTLRAKNSKWSWLSRKICCTGQKPSITRSWQAAQDRSIRKSWNPDRRQSSPPRAFSWCTTAPTTTFFIPQVASSSTKRIPQRFSPVRRNPYLARKNNGKKWDRCRMWFLSKAWSATETAGCSITVARTNTSASQLRLSARVFLLWPIAETCGPNRQPRISFKQDIGHHPFIFVIQKMAVEQRHSLDNGIGKIHNYVHRFAHRHIHSVQPNGILNLLSIFGIDQEMRLVNMHWMQLCRAVQNPPVLIRSNPRTRHWRRIRLILFAVDMKTILVFGKNHRKVRLRTLVRPQIDCFIFRWDQLAIDSLRDRRRRSSRVKIGKHHRRIWITRGSGIYT